MQAAADMYMSYCFQYTEFVASIKVNARGEEGLEGGVCGNVKVNVKMYYSGRP